MVLKKEPRVGLKAYPPSAYRKEHIVLSDEENWWTLADQYGYSSDPWAIIIYNFGTRDPREVNWCLEHFVGCTHSNDGKNYSFSVGNKIYIPPVGWKPDYEEFLRRAVLTVLARPELSRIFFSIKSYEINVHKLRDVANAVIDRKIRVRYNPRLKSQSKSYYNFDADELEFGFYTAMTIEREAVIVHEAAHAALDMAVAHDLKGKEAEAAGYIAQCMYAWVRGGEVSRLEGPTPQDPIDAIFDAATEIGKSFLARKVPPGGLVTTLLNRISVHPWYRANANTTGEYNGV
jgi:hypothetical protein